MRRARSQQNASVFPNQFILFKSIAIYHISKHIVYRECKPTLDQKLATLITIVTTQTHRTTICLLSNQLRWRKRKLTIILHAKGISRFRGTQLKLGNRPNLKVFELKEPLNKQLVIYPKRIKSIENARQLYRSRYNFRSTSLDVTQGSFINSIFFHKQYLPHKRRSKQQICF